MEAGSWSGGGISSQKDAWEEEPAAPQHRSCKGRCLSTRVYVKFGFIRDICTHLEIASSSPELQEQGSPHRHLFSACFLITIVMITLKSVGLSSLTRSPAGTRVTLLLLEKSKTLIRQAQMSVFFVYVTKTIGEQSFSR